MVGENGPAGNWDPVLYRGTLRSYLPLLARLRSNWSPLRTVIVHGFCEIAPWPAVASAATSSSNL